MGKRGWIVFAVIVAAGFWAAMMAIYVLFVLWG
jgi:hypothetical protein